MKDKLTKAFEAAKAKSPDKTLVCLIHPLQWATLTPEEQDDIKATFEIDVPPLERLEVLASLMGAKNDNAFWSPDRLFFAVKPETPKT